MPKHNTVIHGAFEYAVGTLGIISVNPADRIKLPTKSKRIPSFYSEEQLKKLFKESEGCSIEMVIRLSATYGLRRSEVLGLKWSAVDWRRKTIVIQHTVVRVGSKTVRDDTVKEAASYRTMPLTTDMADYLKKLYAHQKQMKKLCKSGYEDSDYICKWDDGKLFDPNYITRKFRQILAAKKLPKIRFHDLRHSSASLLINMGFTLKEVQEWLGHADIASTEIYSHLLYKSKENMADRINRALSTQGTPEADNRVVLDS
jgi:integrase